MTKKKPKKRPPNLAAEKLAKKHERAQAAAEVLAAVWLHDFELECKIDEPPKLDEDADGNPWVTVRIQVPQLDVDMWLDGTHCDHPNNQPDEDES